MIKRRSRSNIHTKRLVYLTINNIEEQDDHNIACSLHYWYNLSYKADINCFIKSKNEHALKFFYLVDGRYYYIEAIESVTESDGYVEIELITGEKIISDDKNISNWFLKNKLSLIEFEIDANS